MPFSFASVSFRPDPRDFRVGERRPGDHRVIGAELPEGSEQRVHRGVPRLVRGGVGELVRPGDVAAGVDVGIDGLQEFVGLDGARLGRRDAQLFQPVARGVGDAPHGAQQFVELDAHVRALVLADQDLVAVLDAELLRLVIDQHVHALGDELLHHHLRNFRVLADQDARQHLDLRHLRAQAREGLGQFRADRPAAQHHQPCRKRADIPEVLGGQAVHPSMPGIGGTNGRAPAAMAMARVVMRWVVPSALFTSTSHGETIFASPWMHSTPRPA